MESKKEKTERKRGKKKKGFYNPLLSKKLREGYRERENVFLTLLKRPFGKDS